MLVSFREKREQDIKANFKKVMPTKQNKNKTNKQTNKQKQKKKKKKRKKRNEDWTLHGTAGCLHLFCFVLLVFHFTGSD